MWIPLVVVIAVLATLVIAPVAVSGRLRDQRRVITDVVDPARVRATNVTSFLAEEMFAVGMRSSSGTPNADPRYVAALRAERRGALALDSLLENSNAEALERFAQYREASTRWHDDVESMTASPNAAVLDTARVDADTALMAARHLGELLEESATAVRANVRSWERVEGTSASVSPIACAMHTAGPRSPSRTRVPAFRRSGESECSRSTLACPRRAIWRPDSELDSP